MKKRIYFENLDGLRFLCFLSVFFYHSFHTEIPEIKNSASYHFIKWDIFGNGNIGVNFFFVLSGFLITFLLIEEKRLNGQVSLKKFWTRRILRIWPLFYFCVIFGFLIFPFIKQLFGQVPLEGANPWYFVFFLNNFDLIYNGSPDASILGVLWSVAIEEQFYLVWPVILFICPLKKLWIPFLVIISGSLVFRAFHDNPIFRELHTFSCIGDMAVGGTGAWLINISDKFKNRITTLPKSSIYFIYVLFVITFFFRDELLMGTHLSRVFERIIAAIIILFIILEQTFSENSFYKMSNFKTISKLGVITYGLYCLHFLGILVATTLTKKLGYNTHLWQIVFVETSVALAVSIVISKLSYRYFESPFLKLKERFAFITKE